MFNILSRSVFVLFKRGLLVFSRVINILQFCLQIGFF